MTRSELTPEVPVVIAGAGPAGLVAAITLARNGIGSLLVERSPSLSPLPRATGVSVRTMELVFQSGPGGTVGAVGFGPIPNDSQGRFRTTVTIPARMDPLQGIGGGPTRPGTYQFTTRPPICNATFTVTSTASGPADTPTPGPADTPGTLPFTGSHTPLLLAIGSGLLLGGAGLLLLLRRHAKLAS